MQYPIEDITKVTLAPGDEVLLTRGRVYSTPIAVPCNGITYRADGVGDAPVVSTPGKYSFSMVGKRDIAIEDIKITGSGGGISVRPDVTAKRRSANISIENCDIVRLPFMAAGSGIFASAVNGLSILNCMVGDVGYDHNEEHNLYIGYGSWMVEIAHCQLYTKPEIVSAGSNLQIWGQGFDTKANNGWFSVHHNTVIGNKICLLVAHLKDSEIYNNVLVPTTDTEKPLHWVDTTITGVVYRDNVVV